MSILIPVVAIVFVFIGFWLGDRAVEKVIGFPEKGTARAAVYTEEDAKKERNHLILFVVLFICVVGGLALTSLPLLEGNAQALAYSAGIGLLAGLCVAMNLTKRRL